MSEGSTPWATIRHFEVKDVLGRVEAVADRAMVTGFGVLPPADDYPTGMVLLPANLVAALAYFARTGIESKKAESPTEKSPVQSSPPVPFNHP